MINKFKFNLSKKELLFLFLLSLFVVMYAVLPYIYGFLIRPSGATLNWINPQSPFDVSVYFSYIRQAMAGRLTFVDLYTLEPQTHGVFNIFWLGVGWFGTVFHLSPPIAYQLSKVLLIPIAVYLIYKWARPVFLNLRYRFFVVFLVIFGAGVGIYAHFILEDNLPFDISVTEGYPYLAFFHSPHFVASYIFLLIVLWLIFRGITLDKIIYTIMAGIFSLVFLNFHPYYAVPILAIAWSFLFIEAIVKDISFGNSVKHGLILILLIAPSVLYHLWLTAIDPIVYIRNLQNLTLTPPLLWVLVGYGFMLFGLVKAVFILCDIKSAAPILKFLAIWALVGFLLLFSPIQFNRRFGEGLILPMAFLAVLYFQEHCSVVCRLYKFSPLIFIYFVAIVFFGTTYANTIFLFGYRWQTLSDIVYVDVDRNAAFKWLGNHPFGNMRILAAQENSNLIPGAAGQFVYAGHWAETLDAVKKINNVKWFLKENRDEVVEKDFLKSIDVNYIFYSPIEARYGFYDPSIKSYLKEVFSSGTVKIYSIINSPSPPALFR